MLVKPDEIIKRSKEIENKLVGYRRQIHRNPEIGFNLPETTKLVSNVLHELGADIRPCGKSGIVCSLGKGKRTVLLRADMDALKIKENTGLNYASKNGNMHACGHDIHTSMLLGAYEILLCFQDKIQGRIAFAFQPAEETLEGARDMVSAGLLDCGVDMAMMIHVISNTDFPVGYTIVSSPGISAPSSDFFKITVEGKSAHGGTPNEGQDALACCARIATLIEDLQKSQQAAKSKTIVSLGTIRAGSATNVIADKAELRGTARAYSEDKRNVLISKLKSITEKASSSYNCKTNFTITSSTPPLFNDSACSDRVFKYARELFGEDMCALSATLGGRGSGGSEDFAYICSRVPGIAVAISAGSRSEGYNVPLHNPKTVLSDDVIRYGASLLAYSALSYFAEKD